MMRLVSHVLCFALIVCQAALENKILGVESFVMELANKGIIDQG